VLNDVHLRVVPIDSVRPHEIADPGRKRRIERRIRDDAVLRDPLLVGAVPDVDGYVLLDGTNRLRALQSIGVAGALLYGLSYVATSFSAGLLWLANFGLVANWFGDSLDGSLARHRKIERPRYGFFIDHSIDVVSQVEGCQR